MVVGPKTPGAGKASRDEARPHSAVIDFVTVVVTALGRALENQRMAESPVDK